MKLGQADISYFSSAWLWVDRVAQVMRCPGNALPRHCRFDKEQNGHRYTKKKIGLTTRHPILLYALLYAWNAIMIKKKLQYPSEKL
jgi:hypothetical protein